MAGEPGSYRAEIGKISSNAFVRLLALRQQEISAALAMRDDDGYSDFFVEGSGPPWHEAFEDVITPRSLSDRISQSRMAFVDRLRAIRVADDDGYSDFFVEGSGPPWHEAFEDVIVGRERLALDPRARTGALSQMKVLDAYAMLQERSARGG